MLDVKFVRENIGWGGTGSEKLWISSFRDTLVSWTWSVVICARGKVEVLKARRNTVSQAK